MPATRADFEKRLSGGGANTDPDLSLGGAISTEVIVSQTNAPLTSSIAGVTVLESLGHDSANFGDGTLAFTFSTTTLTWTPVGSSTGAPVDVSSDGRYAIPDSVGDKYVLVDVVAASLPVANDSLLLDVGPEANKLFDDVSGKESADGHIDYRCFYAINVNGVDDIVNIRMWIDFQPIGPDDIALGLDPGGINSTPAVIANENTAPAGVSFTVPSDLPGALLVGNLTPGDFYPIWIRRNVPVNTLTAQAGDLSRILFEIGLP